MTANDARAAAPPFTADEIAAAEIVLKTSPRVEPFLGEKLRLARAVLRVAGEHENEGAGSTPTGGGGTLPIQGDHPSPPPPPPAEPEPAAPYLPAVGTRVIVTGAHPWAGHSGTVIRHESWTGGPAAVVNLDNGMQAGVTRPSEVRLAM